MSTRLIASFEHYGVAPFEIEALYSILNGIFSVKESEAERPEDDDYACMVEINFPLEFNENFFATIGHKRWDTITFLIKEMRRRTGKKGLRFIMRFTGRPALSFTIAMHVENLFESALEKLEILDELIALQIDPKRLPNDVSEVHYEFDTSKTKWYPKVALGNGTQYSYDNGEWIAYRDIIL